ncbi:MAG: heparinase II/III-family protein, partial [Desulfobacteraceae bacterium]|nr:heparinase II/III-family protein [Desulfobacteraceae bacterium]
PVIGDQDDGRFLPFGVHDNSDHRYLLSIGAVLFGRPDFKSVSDEFRNDAFFYAGSKTKQIYQGLIKEKRVYESKAFKDAGFFIMKNNLDYMFINNSGIPKYFDYPESKASHTHADMLSFELAVNGEDFIVDPGTYQYTGSRESRNLFRSTKMHNTVSIDKTNQHRLSNKNMFAYETVGFPNHHKWETNPEYDLYEGSHTGYLKLPEPVEHFRKFIFHKQFSKWEIVDKFEGSGIHHLEWNLHFDSDVDIRIVDGQKVIGLKNNISIEILFGFPVEFAMAVNTGFVSKSFGSKIEAQVLTISADTKIPSDTFRTEIGRK